MHTDAVTDCKTSLCGAWQVIIIIIIIVRNFKIYAVRLRSLQFGPDFAESTEHTNINLQKYSQPLIRCSTLHVRHFTRTTDRRVENNTSFRYRGW